MTPIFFLTAFLAALAVVGLVWSAAVAAGRADARREAYEAEWRQGEAESEADYAAGDFETFYDVESVLLWLMDGKADER